VRRLAPLLLLLPLLTGGCSKADAHDKPVIVVGAYPFQRLVEQVVGDQAKVVDLAKPGVEPHDIELTPRQIGQIEKADLVFYLKGFQPAVDDAVEGKKSAYDLGRVVQQLRGEGDEGSGKDPHIWLDPVLMDDLATQVAKDVNQLRGSYPKLSVDRLDASEKLHDLAEDIRLQLEQCQSREIVTSHAAFAYFAKRYGLEQRGITGLDPESEPSPKRLAEVASYARSHHVTTIFFESLVSPKVAETVAREVGAKTAVLDPIESVSGADDYLSVMRRNAATLHTALGCR
jgi:zinc transport system substrate-binding protein